MDADQLLAADQFLSAVRAELGDKQGGQAITPFAKQIGISPNTLRALMSKEPDVLQAEVDGWEETKSWKALIGRAESIGRIVQFLNRFDKEKWDPVPVLTSFRLDPTNQYVKQGLHRCGQAVPPPDAQITRGDPTLARILNGGPDRLRNTIRAGVLIWSPYAENVETLPQSFAGKLLRRLLRSLNPVDWEKPDLRGLDLKDVLKPDKLKSGEIDLLVPIYDLPSRRMEGFEFIHLPGLSSPMGAISVGTRRIDWDDILDPQRGGRLQVLVVKHDVGQTLIGTCDYPDERIQTIELDDGTDQNKIAMTVVSRANTFINQQVKYDNRGVGTQPDPFALIGDASVIDKVEEEISTLFSLLKLSEDSTIGHNILDYVREYVHKIPPDALDAPTYPLSIAVSGDSQIWLGILERALISELFINTSGLTAKNYADLLVKPSAIRLCALESNIPQSAQSRFWKHLEIELSERLTKVKLDNGSDKNVAMRRRNVAMRKRIETIIENIKELRVEVGTDKASA
jgi:hypothetical protein